MSEQYFIVKPSSPQAYLDVCAAAKAEGLLAEHRRGEGILITVPGALAGSGERERARKFARLAAGLA